MIAPARWRVNALWTVFWDGRPCGDRKPVTVRGRASGCTGPPRRDPLNGSPGTPTSRFLRPTPLAQHSLYSPVYPFHRGVVHLFHGSAPQDPHLLQVTLHDRPVWVVSG